jgi:hypothetical protein
MEQVALARLVNDEIRTLAERLEVPAEEHVYSWVCACGCFTIVHCTIAEYDANAGRVFAPGHPLGAERAKATTAFEHEPDQAALAARIDESKRRELATDLAKRLERQVMANDG